MFVFQEIWRALFSWNTRFEIRPFALLRTNQGLSLEPPTHMFFCEFCEIFQNSFFIENFRWLLLRIYHLRNANREINSKKYQKYLVNVLIFRSFFLGWILTFRKSYFRNFMVFEKKWNRRSLLLFLSMVCIKGTLMQIWKSPSMFVFM